MTTTTPKLVIQTTEAGTRIDEYPIPEMWWPDGDPAPCCICPVCGLICDAEEYDADAETFGDDKLLEHWEEAHPEHVDDQRVQMVECSWCGAECAGELKSKAGECFCTKAHRDASTRALKRLLENGEL